MRWLHLHQEDGLGITLAVDRVLVVKERAGGGCTISMRGGTFYTVQEPYTEVTGWLESKKD